MHYSATSTIAADPATIWAILTNAEAFPEWEENVTKVEGSIADGESITVHTSLSDQAFPVVVGGWQEAKKMTWTGGMPLGLFRGVRTFTLTAES